MQDKYRGTHRDACNHQRWQYCRRIAADGAQFFGVQCLDCLGIIKLDRHGRKLALKPADIPENSPIHAYINPDPTTGHVGINV